MIKSMFSAVTGLRGHQTMLDVIANNIANVNTVGFKSSRVVFSDLYYQTLSSASAPTATAGGINPMQIGYGASVSSIDLLNTRGGWMQTDKTTDLYIQGDGYFVMQNATGEQFYTRVGNFKFDSSGFLIDANGNHVCGATGVGGALPTDPAVDDMDPIQVADSTTYSSIAIGSGGVITAIDAAGATVTLGQVALATFPNSEGLAQCGSMYMQASSNSGDAVYFAPGSSSNAGTLVAGGLEMSNVDLSKQFTDMIIAQRGFQANSRVITTSDEVLQELVSLKR